MARQTSQKDATSTKEVLTFPVDYNDVTAVDPPAKAVFCTQASITQFLTRKGATNFKHLAAVWYSLPDEIHHNVNINLAAGVHRPRNPESGYGAWNLSKKQLVEGQVYINGVPPSQYTQLVAPATVTAIGPDPFNPYLDFSGTPFAGLDLRGYYLVLDSGQTTLIHKHTASRLYIIDNPTPAPTTGWVGKPATVLRNSYNDIAGTGKDYTVAPNVASMGDIYNSWLNFQDLRIEPFGSYWGILTGSGNIMTTRILFDFANEFDEFGVAYGCRPWNLNGTGTYYYNFLASVRGPLLATPPQYVSLSPIWCLNTGGLGLFWGGYFGGCTNSAYFGTRNLVVFYGVVIDQDPGGGIFVDDWGQFGTQDDLGMGMIRSTIRNCGLHGILFANGSKCASGQGNVLLFEQCNGLACVGVDDNSPVTVGESNNSYMRFANGPAGGNTTVGVKFLGHDATLVMRSGSDVSGTLGDVLMADGTALTYVQLAAVESAEDANGNRIRVQP